MSKVNIFSVVLSLIVALVISQTSSATSIVVTVNPLKILLTDLGVPPQDITTIIPANVDPHEFELAPSHIRLLQQASLIVTASGVEMNNSIIAHKDFLNKLVSIGEPTSHVVHGWLSPNLIFDSLPVIREKIDLLNDHSIKLGSDGDFISSVNQLFAVSKEKLQQCFIVTDHNMLTNFLEKIGCHEVLLLKKTSSSEITLSSLQKLRGIKKEYPSVRFIGSTSTAKTLFSTIENSFSIQTGLVDEAAAKESSFIEYYKHIVITLIGDTQ